MKFIRIIGILLILFVVSLTAERCFKCKCPKIKTVECSISSFSINQLDGEELKRIMAGSLPAGVVDNPLECRKDFGIEFVFETKNTVIANCKPVNSLFIQSAYACECEEYQYYAREGIISILVFSDKDFDETHPAGTDITEFFKIHEWDATQYPYLAKLTSFESYFKYPRPSPASVIYHDYWYRFYCVLMATDIEAGEYEFTFVVNLSDERTLEQSIKAVLQ